ncbi:ABC transporter permease subunit [Micrococcus luteus]
MAAWRIYFRILLPISLPALATTAIFTFIWTWNDFLSQLIYLTKPELQTAPVALRNYVDATSGASWGSLFAMSVITLIPVFIVFLVICISETRKPAKAIKPIITLFLL